MKQRGENKMAEQVSEYISPSITIIRIGRDVITESHNDPNMGEWDTEV